jgi:hypothetical protein
MKTSTTNKGNTMQIQLTQDELKDAVRQYIANDFNLDGRTVAISFTATRGDAGVITNLTISKAGDVDIPGYTDAPADAAPAVVAEDTKVEVAMVVVATEAPEAAAPEAKEEDIPAAEAAPPAATEAPKTTSSLFG